jgi:hypothetical protein
LNDLGGPRIEAPSTAFLEAFGENNSNSTRFIPEPLRFEIGASPLNLSLRGLRALSRAFDGFRWMADGIAHRLRDSALLGGGQQTLWLQMPRIPEVDKRR